MLHEKYSLFIKWVKKKIQKAQKTWRNEIWNTMQNKNKSIMLGEIPAFENFRSCKEDSGLT